MYTLDYLNCFIENLDLPEASRASLRENCETLVTTPGAIDELVSAETLLFKDYGIDGAYGAEWKPIVPHMDALSERTGLHRHVVDFLFLALASERLRENYRAAGLTDELFRYSLERTSARFAVRTPQELDDLAADRPCLAA